MAELPPLPVDLPADTRAAIERNTTARAHADGHPRLAEVYAALFHEAGLAERVSALGEQLRFHGTLPDDLRELVILRYAVRAGLGYEWSHHLRPAELAGIDRAAVDALTEGAIPSGLADDRRAALLAVDAGVEGRSIPAVVQATVVAAHGTAGIVEVVGLCGLYALMGYVVTSFDLPLEDHLVPAPFSGPVPG